MMSGNVLQKMVFRAGKVDLWKGFARHDDSFEAAPFSIFAFSRVLAQGPCILPWTLNLLKVILLVPLLAFASGMSCVAVQCNASLKIIGNSSLGPSLESTRILMLVHLLTHQREYSQNKPRTVRALSSTPNSHSLRRQQWLDSRSWWKKSGVRANGEYLTSITSLQERGTRKGSGYHSISFEIFKYEWVNEWVGGWVNGWMSEGFWAGKRVGDGGVAGWCCAVLRVVWIFLVMLVWELEGRSWGWGYIHCRFGWGNKYHVVVFKSSVSWWGVGRSLMSFLDFLQVSGVLLWGIIDWLFVVCLAFWSWSLSC